MRGSVTARVEQLLTDSPFDRVAQLSGWLRTTLGVQIGGILRITTPLGRSTLVRVAEAPAGEASLDLIRLDAVVRRSLKARLHDHVELSAVAAPPAVEDVNAHPLADLTYLRNASGHIAASLVERQVPLSDGDVVLIPFPERQHGFPCIISGVAPGPGVAAAGLHVHVVVGEDHTHAGHADEGVPLTLEDVGGLEHAKQQIRELVEMPLAWPQVYQTLGIKPARGVLLYGPPGTGKTLLARAVAAMLPAHFHHINGPDIVAGTRGDTEQQIRKLFAHAVQDAPSIILIDEVDSIAPRRDVAGTLADSRMVTQLLACMDGLQNAMGVTVLATTNRLEALDAALRRPGRFDREIYVGPPDKAGRLDILRVHTREMPLSSAAEAALDEVAAATDGYVGADLVELCREAGLQVIRRTLPRNATLASVAASIASIVVDREDFDFALERVQPSLLRDVRVEMPQTAWSDVVGAEGAKRRLGRLLRQFREQQHRAPGRGSVGGILLSGPPGVGKTTLARAIAHELGSNFLHVDGPKLFRKWFAESEEAVRDVFRIARQVAPSIVFLDQLDAIAPRRSGESTVHTVERVVNQLMIEIDSATALRNVLVVAETNRPDMVDPAILRGGRISNHIALDLPDRDERVALAARFLAEEGQTLAPSAELAAALATATQGMSGADLRALVQEALFLADEQQLAVEDAIDATLSLHTTRAEARNGDPSAARSEWSRYASS